MNEDILVFEMSEFEIVHNVSEGSIAVKLPNGFYDKSVISRMYSSENLTNTELTIKVSCNKYPEIDGTLTIIGYERLEKQTHDLEGIITYRGGTGKCPTICKFVGIQQLIDNLRDWFNIKHLIDIIDVVNFEGAVPDIIIDEDISTADIWFRRNEYFSETGRYNKDARVSILSSFYVMVLMSRAELIPDFFLNKHCNLIKENMVKFNSICKKYNDTVLKQSSFIKQYEVACMPDHYYY